MNLTETQSQKLDTLKSLIQEKYSSLIWENEYYSTELEGTPIQSLLTELFQEGVEVNFGVSVHPYQGVG